MSRSIIKKAAGVGSSTLLSRVIAFAREILLLQFLGVGAISDAFFMAFRVPNTLRKVFAEGALSSVIVPALVSADQKEGKAGVSKLTTASFLVIESLIAMLCVGIYWYANETIGLIAPGFSAQQIALGGDFLRVLVSFILFISSSAILGGALQSAHHFFIPAISPAMLNVCYVIALSVSLYFSWSVTTFCICMIIASILNLFMHLFVYWRLNFSFKMPDRQAWHGVYLLLLQLLPCILSMSIGEINFFIDAGFASYLPSGTFSLVRYAYRFVGIPLGVLASSFAIVLLPYFSKIGDSKEKMGNYIHEAMKFVSWMIIPVTVAMMVCSREIFETIFFSDKFNVAHVLEAEANMKAFLLGLLFFSLEKVLLNVFYALRSTNLAMVIALTSAAMNFFMDRALISMYGGMGLALATSIAAMFRVVMFVVVLRYYFGISLQMSGFTRFFARYALQVALFSALFVSMVQLVTLGIHSLDFSWTLHLGPKAIVFDVNFFLHSFGYWLWFGPLSLAYFIGLYATRRYFGIKMSYLD